MKELQINLNVPKRKGKKRKTYQRVETKESKCKHKLEMDADYGEYYCSLCYQVMGLQFKYEKKLKMIAIQDNNFIWHCVYDRNRWKEDLVYLNGSKNHEWPDGLWLDILQEIPNPFTWHEVYKVFRKYNLHNWWLGFGCYIQKPPPISALVIQRTTDYIQLSNNSRYKINYLYLLYKFAQMNVDEESDWIPLHRSKSWLCKTDVWWKEMCVKENWPYKPSKVACILWDKEGWINLVKKSCVWVENKLQVPKNKSGKTLPLDVFNNSQL